MLRRKARRRRDLLNEIMRALAKLDEALMASLGVGLSSALEEQGAPATGNKEAALGCRGSDATVH